MRQFGRGAQAQDNVGGSAVDLDKIERRFFPVDTVCTLGVAHARGRRTTVYVHGNLTVALTERRRKFADIVEKPILVPALEETVGGIADDIPCVATEIQLLLPGLVPVDHRALGHPFRAVVAARQVLDAGNEEIVEEELPPRTNL